MNRKWKILIWSVAVVLFANVCITFMAEYDYQRVGAGQKPRFAFSTWPLADGGTVEYLGPLYTVVYHHGYSMASRPDWASTDGWAYDVGPEITYWFASLCPWWHNRKNVSTVVDRLHLELLKTDRSTQQSPGGYRR
jgi:hypothetical protein